MADRQKHTITAYFNDISGEYVDACDVRNQVSVRSYIFSSRKRRVLDMFNLKNGRVLDIGCGPAVFTEELLKNGCEVWGIDISENMIKQANKRMQEKGFKEKFHFSTGDIEKLDFPDGNFDFVLCVGVLEYLKDDPAALKEIRRVLKDRGEAIITVPNMASPFVLFDKAVLVITRLFLRMLHDTLKLKIKISPKRLSLRDDIIHKYYLPWRLDVELEKNGFEINMRRFHSFGISGLNYVSPQLALYLMKKLEFLTNYPLRQLGIDYIIRASKR